MFTEDRRQEDMLIRGRDDIAPLLPIPFHREFDSYPRCRLEKRHVKVLGCCTVI